MRIHFFILIFFGIIFYSALTIAKISTSVWQQNNYIKKYELDYARVCREKFPRTVEDLATSNCQNVEGVFDLLNKNRDELQKVSSKISESFNLEILRECQSDTSSGEDRMLDYLNCLESKSIIHFEDAIGGSFFDENHREMETLINEAKFLYSVEKVANLRCDFATKSLEVVADTIQKKSSDNNPCQRDFDPLKTVLHPLVDGKSKNKFPHTIQGHYLKDFKKKFVQNNNQDNFQKCANLYSFPVFKQTFEVSDHARACLELCKTKQNEKFCQEVSKLPQVEKERQKGNSYAGCVNEFYQAKRIGEQGIEFGTSFSQNELIDDLLKQNSCSGNEMLQIFDSYDDLESIRKKVAGGEESLDFWLDALLRSTAIQKQIQNHCEVFGGPFNISPSTCPEFKKSFSVMLDSPDCKNKKPFHFNIEKMGYLKKIVDQSVRTLKQKINEYDEISGFIDGGIYYTQKGLSYISSKVENPTAYAEQLEKEIKDSRMTLIRLAEQFPKYFVGADFEQLNFPVIDRYDPYEINQEEQLFALENFSRGAAIENAQNFLGDLCNRDVVSLDDLLHAPNLVDKMKDRFPRYKKALQCYQTQANARDDFFMGMKVMGIVGCIGLSFGPQAAIVAPICTAIGIGDATANYINNRDNLEFQQNCYSNTDLCSTEELVQAVESFNSSLNDLQLEFWMAPFFISEIRDLMKVGKLATKVSPQKLKAFVQNLSPEDAIKLEERLRKGELNQEQLLNLVANSKGPRLSESVINADLAKRIELNIFTEMGLDFMEPGMLSKLSSGARDNLVLIQQNILKNPNIKTNLEKAMSFFGELGKQKVKNFIVALAELPQKTMDLVLGFLSEKKLTSNDVGHYIDDVNRGGRACSGF